MSEWASLTPCGEPVTSFEFRDEYLRTGTVHEEFYCPFCGIKLIAVSIYRDEKSGKSPHFRYHPPNDHKFGCDGQPIADDSPRNVLGGKIEARDLHYPEELIPYVQRRKRESTSTASLVTPTAIEVSSRRNRFGKVVGVARYRTSLLKPVCDAHAEFMGAYRDKIEAEGIKVANQWLKQALSALPLKLFGAELTYDTAIWKTVYVRADPRIYWGRGFATHNDGWFEISSDKQTITTDPQRSLDAFLRIDRALLTDPIGTRSPAMSLLQETLRTAVQTRAKVTWYCYGILNLTLDRALITPSSWEYVYIRPS